MVIFPPYIWIIYYLVLFYNLCRHKIKNINDTFTNMISFYFIFFPPKELRCPITLVIVFTVI